MAIKAISQRLPALRLYQQIILYVIFVVFVPLLVSSFIIYSINQKALKKELVRFTEHTAEIITTDLTAQLDNQQSKIKLMGKVLADGLRRQRSSTDVLRQVMALSNDVLAIGLYDEHGQRLTALSRQGETPESIPPTDTINKVNEPSTLTLSPNVVDDALSYQLIAQAPINVQTSSHTIRQFRLVSQFDSLTRLVKAQNQKLYKGFYLFSPSGELLAGPDNIVKSAIKKRQPDSDNATTPSPYWSPELKTMRAGKTTIARGNQSGLLDKAKAWLEPILLVFPFEEWLDKDDDPPPVQKVLIKLPNEWGVVLESPYEVRQKYVKRARTQTLLILLGHLLLAGGFTAIYIGGLRRNFRQLIKGIQALADGRYSRRIRLLTNWFTPFEIVYLTGEFNRMSRRREEAWEESEALTQELRQANNKLAELDKMKSNLIDTVSHELRTPLTSIKGYTNQLIRHDDKLDKDMRIDRLKTIKRQADRLNRLVDDLLVIPELEQHHLRVECTPITLGPTLKRAITLVSTRKQAVPMNTDWDISDETFILADPDRLEQVLVNVLDNAQKYGDGESPITITVAPAEQENVAISVSNIALPDYLPTSQQEVDSLFEKFKRLDDTTTRTTRGTGLGLYITQGLMEAMGGNVSATVNDKTFTVNLILPKSLA
jgi:signal transduction histidine kinase